MNSVPKPAPNTDLILLASLYGAEFAAVLIGLALNKLSGRPMLAWPLSGANLAFLVGLGLLATTLVIIARAYVKRAAYRRTRAVSV